MGSFIIIVIKLSSYKYGDVINIQKFEYLIRIFKTFADVREKNLTRYF